MGYAWIDQYSLLHFAVGILLYFWGFSWQFTLGSHILFEIVENTKLGMKLINEYIPVWPGGKPQADSLLNSVTDTLFSLLGWYVSQWADSISTIHHLYYPKDA